MAKVKFGAMMVDARGKLGGHVYSKNRGGAYMRTKVTPTNPQSLDQSEVRSIFGSISQSWSNLTDDQRATWNGAVENFKTTDVFGDLRTPSGKALFQRLNQGPLLGGRPVQETAPGLEEAPQEFLTGVNIDTALSGIFTAGLSTDPANLIVLRSSGPVTQGTSNVTNRMRIVSIYDADSELGEDNWNDYVEKFGVPSAGQKIYFSASYILANGVQTPATKQEATFI